MKIIVVGCGRIGSALATRLSVVGHSVVVIDPEREEFARLGRAFTGRVLDGLGFDQDTLRRAGIHETDALAAVTSDDSSNVIIARLARERYNVARVVARLCEERHARLYQVLGIQTASTVKWGVDRLEQLLCAPTLEGTVTIGDGGVEIVDLYVPPELVGRAVSDLQIAGETQVIALTRGGATSLPSPGLLLQAGDLLHLGIARGVKADLVTRLVQEGGEAA